VAVPEGKHDITFSTVFGEKTIQVLAKAKLDPECDEVPLPSLSEMYATKDQDAKGGGGLDITLDNDHLYLAFGGRKIDYAISKLPVIRERYEKLRAPLSKVPFPKVEDYAIKFLRCHGDYALACVDIKLAKIHHPPYTFFPSMTHLFLVFLNRDDVAFIKPPHDHFRKQESTFDIKLSDDGKIIWIDRVWHKDIDYSETIHVWDSNNKRKYWKTGYGKHILTKGLTDQKTLCTLDIKMAGENMVVTHEGQTTVFPLEAIKGKKRGGQLVSPRDDKSLAASLRCAGDYAVVPLVEKYESTAHGKPAVKYYHTLLYFERGKVLPITPPIRNEHYGRDGNIYVTENGNLVLREGLSHIFYWDKHQRAWKKVYVPLVPSHDFDTVYSSECGGAGYNHGKAYFFSRTSVDFLPCAPEVDVLMHEEKPYLKARSGGRLFKTRLYQIKKNPNG